MEKTRKNRYFWITHTRPPVADILEKFPLLKESQMICREFRYIAEVDNVKSLKEEWPVWVEKLVKFAKVEAVSRPTIKKLLSEMDNSDDISEVDDFKDSFAVELLSKLLYPRGPTRNGQFIVHFKTCDVDLEHELTFITQSEPFIIVTGKAGDENAQFFICAEQAITMECKSLRDAYLDLKTLKKPHLALANFCRTLVPCDCLFIPILKLIMN